MRKVMILSNHILGLYNFRRELIHELLEKDYQVIICAPYDEKVSYFVNQGCIFVETSMERRGVNIFNDLKLLYSYWCIIKNHRPNIVLTYTIKPNVYGGIICRLLNTPYISNITGLGSALEKKGLLQKVTLVLYKLGLKKAKCVFFQNEDNLKFMHRKHIALYNSKLIPGSGVNLDYFELLDYPDKSSLNFIYISRIMKEKGIEQFLDMAKHIKTKYPYTSFHVLGNCDEDYLDVLREHEKNGYIKYHGRQDDVREFHKISHCTVHPTFYPEGMSNVLLESAACGRPIITTNRSGCKEVVDDGVNGFLVEPNNSIDLIAKVESFINLSYEEKKQMGLAGRIKVKNGFDRKIVINAYWNEITNTNF